jgi:UDP-glucose 4-epimerase
MSPYGESKLVTERALPWFQLAFGLQWVALRYFNVAGAEDSMGEELAGCRRIVPRTVHAAVGGGAALGVFGTDFDTVDGSAVRDYVHVSDVANANLLALRYVEQNKPPAVMNIAAGVGTSVLQIIDEVGRQTGKPVPHKFESARGGDPGCAIADISRARKELGWNPVASGLHHIVASVLHSGELQAGGKSN